jgi:hypothetical protein
VFENCKVCGEAATEVGSSRLVTLAYPILEFEHPLGRYRLTYHTQNTRRESDGGSHKALRHDRDR